MSKLQYIPLKLQLITFRSCGWPPSKQTNIHKNVHIYNSSRIGIIKCKPTIIWEWMVEYFASNVLSSALVEPCNISVSSTRFHSTFVRPWLDWSKYEGHSKMVFPFETHIELRWLVLKLKFSLWVFRLVCKVF
jgi:hypothetical protein